MKARNKSGFTLLEVIIVVIIVGVLMSLALPRFFNVVEQSRGAEALNNISSVRGAMVRCQLKYGTYASCTAWGNLDVANPENAPGAHFTYALASNSPTSFTITANRTTKNGGDPTHLITLYQEDGGGTPSVDKAGTTAFTGI